MVSADTAQPFGAGHPRIERGATVGYDRETHEEALAAVKAFLGKVLLAGR